MRTLVFLFICADLQFMAPGLTSQNAFFIPIPSSLAPITKFGCPDPGTVFTYDVPAWNTNRPNRMIAIEEDQFNCRIKSDAQGIYDWYGGLGPHFEGADAGEKQLIAEIWPLRAGHVEQASKYGPPSKYSDIEYAVVAYGAAVVPAGVFWAYKIKKNYYWQNELAYTTTLWWSPSLKWTILQWPEEVGKPARTGGNNWGLVSVSTPQRQGQ
jgi:hypothetical protein